MRIPVLLVTGFLGSGKTTLLRVFAAQHPDLRLVFLVNEFAEHEVDAARLSESGLRVHSVLGGSMFCDCKAGEFIRVMREPILQAHAQQALDAVVVETSGIANPDAIGTLIREPVLSPYFEIRRIVTVVSPPRLPTLLANLPVVRTQIQGSDLILINKVDLCSEDSIAQAEQLLRAENPQAQLLRTSHCEAAFDWTQRREALPAADLATLACNPFVTQIVQWQDAMAEPELEAWLQGLPDFILRAKGAVKTGSGWKQIDKTVDHFQMIPTHPHEASSVTLIVHEDHKEALQKHLKTLTEAVL